jgi:hypothetical protein
MTFHEYLAKARQHDAQQAGERDRLLQTARQTRTARRHRNGPAALARRLARLILRRAPHRACNQLEATLTRAGKRQTNARIDLRAASVTRADNQIGDRRRQE